MERTTIANTFEKIQKLMLYIGIDIGKNKYDLACIAETENILVSNLEFANYYYGFLVQLIKSTKHYDK